MRHKAPSKRKPETAPVDEKHRSTAGSSLGRGNDAGHPAVAPDLDANSDHEEEDGADGAGRKRRRSKRKEALMVECAKGANRTVRDVMIREVVSINSSTNLLEAAKRMRDSNVGMLPVMQDGVLRGVVTDRDLVVRAMTRDVRPSEVRVDACLSEPARWAEPDWSLDDAMEEMAGQRVGRLPVVDERGGIVGVVTLSSLALRSPKRQQTLETAQEVSRRSARSA